MADKKSSKELKNKKAYVIAGVCSLVFLSVGYVLELLSDWKGEFIPGKHLLELTSHIFNEIGIAGLIAIVLAFTIEKLTFAEFRNLLKDQNKKFGYLLDEQNKEFDRLLEEQTTAIKKNVFNYLMEHSVPHEITREIESQILKAVFVRRGLTINYTIEPVNEGPAYEDYVKVGLKLTYTIENLTSKDQPFEIKHTVELSPEPLLKQHVKFISLDVVGCAKPISKNDRQLLSLQKEDGPDLMLCIPRISVHPGEQKPTTVTVKSQTIKHLKGGADYHIVRHHTCDIELTVHLYNLDLDVNAGTVPHNSMEAGEETDSSKGLYHWKSELPLLAGQNIYVTWVPKHANEAKLLKPAPALGSVMAEHSDAGAAPEKNES